MGLLLFVLATLLACLLLPAGLLFGLFVALYRHRLRSGLRRADRKLLALAIALDQYGGVVCAELLNATLIKKESPYRFGAISDTISRTVGLNRREGYLTRTGRALNRLLNFIDPGHTAEASV
jgi:8-oxo-dGTP diphosphatase